MGIILARYDLLHITNRLYLFIGTVLTGIAWFFCCRTICYFREGIDTMLPFGEGVNPPGVCLMLYAISCLLLVYFASSFLASLNIKPFNWLMNVASWIGQRTLYIFLYHRLFLDYILVPYLPDNLFVRRIVIIPTMVIGPILLEIVVKRVKQILLPLVNPPAAVAKIEK